MKLKIKAFGCELTLIGIGVILMAVALGLCAIAFTLRLIDLL